jgi:hypothetical protein
MNKIIHGDLQGVSFVTGTRSNEYLTVYGSQMS